MSPLLLLGGAAVAVGIGWTINGWRLSAEIQTIKTERAEAKVTQATAALSDLTAASKQIKAAANGAKVNFSALDQKLSNLEKEFKNAKPAPLPPGCLLDDVRLRELNAAATAVNETIARRKSGSGMQAADRP